MTVENSTMTAFPAGQFTIAADLTANRMGFGAMRLTGRGIWGHSDDPEQSKSVLRRALDLEVNFIDTADSYGPEVSEQIIAEELFPYPSELIIATKGGLERPGPGQWRPNGRPEHLRSALEGSLRRLRLDRIDLYQFHRPDPQVPLEESIGALADLQLEGKIRHIGISNVNNEQLARAQRETRIVSVQNRYNVGDRASDDVLEKCEEQGIAFLPWAPLGQGTIQPAEQRLQAVAVRHGASSRQIALAWLLSRSPVVIVIPGTNSRSHLEENVAAAAIQLIESDLNELEMT